MQRKDYQKIQTILNCVIGSFTGVFMAEGIYTYWDYRSHPDLYAVSSAPWYTALQVFGIGTAVIVGAAVALKIIVWKKSKP